MKHLKTYEKNYIPSVEKDEQLIKFISDEFDLDNKPQGKIEFLDYTDSINIYITVRNINNEFFKQLNDFFKDCKIFIEPMTSDKLTIHVILLDVFIEKLLIKINTKKYNI